MLSALKKRVHPRHGHHPTDYVLTPFVTRIKQPHALQSSVDIVAFAIGKKSEPPEQPPILTTKEILKEHLNQQIKDFFPGEEHVPELEFRGIGFSYGKRNARQVEERKLSKSDTTFYWDFSRTIKGSAPSHIIIQVPLLGSNSEGQAPTLSLPEHFDLIEAFITSVTERAESKPVIFFQVPDEFMRTQADADKTRSLVFNELLAPYFTGDEHSPKNSYQVRALPLYCCSTSPSNRTLLPPPGQSEISAPFKAFLSSGLVASARSDSKSSPMTIHRGDSGRFSMYSASQGSPREGLGQTPPDDFIFEEPAGFYPSAAVPSAPMRLQGHRLYPELTSPPGYTGPTAPPHGSESRHSLTRYGSNA